MHLKEEEPARRHYEKMWGKPFDPKLQIMHLFEFLDHNHTKLPSHHRPHFYTFVKCECNNSPPHSACFLNLLAVSKGNRGDNFTVNRF